MHIEFPRSLKRIANEKQSGSEKATKPCGVSLKLNWTEGGGGLVETGKWVRGGVWGVSLTRQHSVSKAGEASFRACYPSCPLARLSSGSASHRCCHHYNFQSTFWLQNSRVGVCVCVRVCRDNKWFLMKASQRGGDGRYTKRDKLSKWAVDDVDQSTKMTSTKLLPRFSPKS